jgi:integral membrane sensor domain MASE1/GAF domain-containing protein/anti-sigma regulatory factor (Ser/Thr protein kinase)
MHDAPAKRLAPLATVLAVGAAYAVGAQLSWTIFGAGDLGPSFFPPAGITIAALVLLPRRQWAGVLAACAVAEVAVDAAHGVSIALALAFAVANVAEPLMGASLLALVGARRPRLDTLSGLVRFAGCAVVAGPIVGASIGVLAKVVDGTSTHVGTDLLTWWAGDALAVLVIGAPLIFFADPRRDRVPQARRRELFALWCTAFAVALVGVLWHAVPLSWLVVPVMLWAALRLEVPGAFVAAPTVSVILNWGVASGHDPFQRFGDPSLRVQVLFAQGFAALAMFLGWVVGVERRERRMMQGEHDDAALLARVALVLQSPAGDIDALLGALARALTPDACDACTVRVVRGDRLELAAATAIHANVEAGLRRMPAVAIADDPSSVARAARSRATVVDDFVADGYAERVGAPEQRDLARDHIHAVMSVPMIARDQMLGVLTLATLRSTGRTFTDHDRALAEEFASRCALVLRERSLRTRAERSEVRLQQLRRAINALAGAETMDDVLIAVGEVGATALDASRMLVVARADDGFVLRAWSAPDGVTPAPRDEPPPLRRAIATAAPVFLASVGELAQFGRVAAQAIGRTGSAWAAVPFPGTWSVRGGLWCCFLDPQEFELAHQDALTAYADSLGQALERVRAQDEERRGRMAAEWRTALVSALVRAESVGDVAEIVSAEGCKAAGCDRAVLAVVEWGGQLRVFEPRANDDGEVRVRQERAPEARALEITAAVAGEVQFVDDVRALPDDEREAVGHDVAAFASVPLVDPDDDETLGVLAFTWREPQRLRRPRRELALSVAGKVAETIQRIRAQESERLLQYQAAQLGLLTSALARASTATDMADIVSGKADAAFAAQRAWMRILDESTGLLMLVGTDSVGAGRRAAAVVDGTTPGGRAALTGEPVYVESRERMAELFPPETLAWLPGADAVAAFPLFDHGQVAGTLTLAFERRVPFGEAECNTFETFAAVLGQTLERVRLTEHREGVAITLQHAMLGRPDDVEAVAVSTAYRPADERLQVGGDWYDVIELSGSRVGLVVGDVVGHHLEAAATMGQLRAALRALAVVLEDPAAVVRALERLVAHDDAARSSTLLYAVLDPDRQTLRYCATGHPPPLLVHQDGECEFLLGGRGAPLGSFRPIEPQAATATLPLGSTLVLYTDGLVERRREVLDTGLDRLAALAPLIAATPVSELADTLLDAMIAGTREDDVAILVARSAPARLHRCLAGSPDELAVLRRDVRAWFEPMGVSVAESEEMLVAIGEAVANAIEHAYVGRESGPVEIELHRSDGDGDVHGTTRVCALVRDRGSWRPPSGDATRGRGLHLMRAFCPDVDVRRSDDGTEVFLARDFKVVPRRFTR